MSILSKFIKWLQPDIPEPVKPKPSGSEFQTQRPEKCQFLYGEFTKVEPHIVMSTTRTLALDDGTIIPNNLLIMQVVWSQGIINSVDKIYLNDLDVDSESFGYIEENLSNGITVGGKKAKYHHVLDGTSQTLQVGGTSTVFKGTGNSYSVIAILYDEELMPSKPKITGSGTGKVIKRLLTGLTTYTNDAIDVIYDYATNDYGAKISTDLFTLSQLQSERTFTSQLVTNSDNEQQSMMMFNGVIDGNKKAIENLNDIRKQLRAFMPLIDGKYQILIERERTPESFVIDDSNRMSNLVVNDVDSGDLLSQVIIRFNDKEQGGKESKVVYPENSDNENTVTITLPGVNNAYEAMQYAAVVHNRSSQARTAEISVKKEGDNYHVGQVIQITEPRMGMNAKNWLIESKTVNKSVVKFEFIEYVESIYPWVAHPIPTVPVASVPDNRSVNAPTNLVKTEVNGDTIISWDSDYSAFNVQKIISTVISEVGTTENKYINLGNLPQGTHSVVIRAKNGIGYPSKWIEFPFVVNTPATPTGLTVTDAYIEWSHPNLSDVKSFVVETTETNTGDIVAHPVAKSSNGIQRLEISGIKVGDYDVSVIAIGLNNLESNPATLTNAQIDGVTTNITPIINDAVAGFAADPHTWTALNNFTGGLKKDGVDLLKVGDYGVGFDSHVSNDLNSLNTPDGMSKYLVVSGAANNPFPDSGHVIEIGADNASRTGQIVLNYSENLAAFRNNSTHAWVNFSFQENNETITGDKNFTGDLLKNGSPVIGLQDLTYNSDESLAIASTTIEQFYKDQEAGLYDNFDSGVGSLAAGFVNSIINQANFLIANNANIDKLKSSAIEVSGSGYALNQNPTWQDTLDGWSFSNGLTVDIQESTGVIAAKNRIQLTTSSNNEPFFSESIPVSSELTYTVSVWVYSTSSATQTLAVRFFDSTGATISGTSGGTTGWDGVGAYNYFGLVNQSAPAQWVKHEIKFGANGDASIPSGATSCAIGGLSFYSGSTSGKLYLQDYRIEKAMGSVHIENGSINADHLVLSGNGSITFNTVGADQAGSALTAENNAKAYAFPQANAGALASLDTIGSTHIDNDSVTTPKIAASQALIDKLVANYIFGTNATFTGEVYARNITGDANERGESALPDKTIPQNSYTMLFEIDLGNDPYLDRELTIESFPVEGNPDFRWRIHSTTTGGSVNHAYTSEGLFFSSPSSKGSTARITDQVKIFIPKATTIFVSVAAGRFLFTDPASTSSSNNVIIGTRALSSSLDGNITTY